MAGALELDGVEARRLGEPVEGEVPGQRVGPFVAERVDGLRLPIRSLSFTTNRRRRRTHWPRIVSGSGEARTTTGMAVGHCSRSPTNTPWNSHQPGRFTKLDLAAAWGSPMPAIPTRPDRVARWQHSTDDARSGENVRGREAMWRGFIHPG